MAEQTGAVAQQEIFGLPKPQGWPIERITSMVAGVMVIVSLTLGQLHDGRWRLLTAWIGLNLVLNAVVGWCPMSAVLHKFGVPLASERGGSCRR